MQVKIVGILVSVLLLSGCHAVTKESDIEENSSVEQQETKQVEATAYEEEFPGSYTIPDGWVLSKTHTTGNMIFYVEEGQEDNPLPDNISVSVGKNRYSTEEHMTFRDAIMQQLLMQLDGVDAQLNGEGTYTEQGDVLYIFTIEEEDVVTKQYYIVKDYGFCLVQLTNFTGKEDAYESAQTIVDSFVWKDIEA